MRILLITCILTASVFAQAPATPLQAVAACGPYQTRFDVTKDATQHPLGQPEPGQALVYVIQDGGIPCILCSTTTRVGVDGAWIGANDGNSYFFFNASPGEHHLCTDQQFKEGEPRKASLNRFIAEAGKTYYFRARVTVQIVGNTTRSQNLDWVLDLDAINSDEGQLLVSNAAFSSWHLKK